MTKHDTWVQLKAGNPFEPILDLFPDGMIPMRDPFPLERVIGPDGEEVALFIVDLERLSTTQANAIAQLIAKHCNVDATEVAKGAVACGGFQLNHQWVEKMDSGPEGFCRANELADFFETVPQPPSTRAWREFYDSQHEHWIKGNETPPPINSIEDIHPSLRTPELEQRLKLRQAEQVIAPGNYTVLDVLTGRAMVDALNIIDPDGTYSLVDDDEG